ncbi:hypothetical protein CVT24_001391 [Panaeolus cyanescens]|uniref:G domain-containing protein n=1 Tax=Panaeolus cyanescens TaxID=181874 RepID=A0A409YYV0_9AGAR|nr:hypothetical protein CVT24_001391 [Panaeolus cyanescens]
MSRLIQTGDVSVERWTRKLSGKSCSWAGSGKSSFIEALAGSGQNLGISGSTLESVTKEVQAYRVVNLQRKWDDGDIWPIYLVDTPGFLDGKMSEAAVASKIQKWMDENGRIHSVFYFCRINDKRIPGTAHRLIDIVKILDLDNWTGEALTIVTTMWDILYRQTAKKHAEDCFSQLYDKDKIKERSQIVAFKNTQPSAMEILRTSKSWFFSLPDLSSNDSITPLLFSELLDRISHVRSQRQALQDAQSQLLTLDNHESDTALRSSLIDVDQQLINHLQQLVSFKTPPAGSIGNIQSIIYECLLDITLSSQQFVHAIEKILSSPHFHPSYASATYLQQALLAAKTDFQNAYNRLHAFGPPPPGVDPFIPTDFPPNPNCTIDFLGQTTHRLTANTIEPLHISPSQSEGGHSGAQQNVERPIDSSNSQVTLPTPIEQRIFSAPQEEASQLPENDQRSDTILRRFKLLVRRGVHNVFKRLRRLGSFP